MSPRDLFAAASRTFRSRRMRRFAREFGITAATRVLDIGGTPYNWELLDVRPRLVMLNMPRAGEEMENAHWVAGDGRALPFPDRSFDVVFSNSVIEHLGDFESQRAFAREVARVGVRYFVQTPNRWFPVETHLLTPLVHLLPRRWQAPLVRRCAFWIWISGARGERRRFYLEHYLNDIRLLDAGQMRGLFPGAALVRERFCGLTKSLIAMLR